MRPSSDESVELIGQPSAISLFIEQLFPNHPKARESSPCVEVEYKYFPPKISEVFLVLSQRAELVQDKVLMRAFKFGPRDNSMIPEGIDLIRIRDEGNGVKVAIKKETNHHAIEQEFDAGEAFDVLLGRFTGIGLTPYQEMEKYRTTWRSGDCSIVFDECPGLEPFFEIEGPTEKSVEATWGELGGEKVWGEKKKMSGTDLYRQKFGPDILTTESQVTFSNPRFN